MNYKAMLKVVLDHHTVPSFGFKLSGIEFDANITEDNALELLDAAETDGELDEIIDQMLESDECRRLMKSYLLGHADEILRHSKALQVRRNEIIEETIYDVFLQECR